MKLKIYCAGILFLNSLVFAAAAPPGGASKGQKYSARPLVDGLGNFMSPIMAKRTLRGQSATATVAEDQLVREFEMVAITASPKPSKGLITKSGRINPRKIAPSPRVARRLELLEKQRMLGKIPNESNIDKWIALNNEWDAFEQQIAREDEAFAAAEEADEREERKSSESSL